MFLQQPKISSSPSDIDESLAQIGLTREIVENVTRSAAAARAEALPVDPANAPGQLSYIFGVRAIRMNLLPQSREWKMSTAGNVEATVNEELGVQFCFQNVDRACEIDHEPQAISVKGAGSRALVAAGQMDLFSEKETSIASARKGSTPAVWLICVSADENSVRAEVSRPRSFYGPQFEGYHERIFVLDEEFGPEDKSAVQDDDFGDFDVTVSRK